MIDSGLHGKVAIVTGINNPRGIGAAVARALVAQGVSVFGTYLRSEMPDALIAEAAQGVPGEALYRLLSSLDGAVTLDEVRAAGGHIEAVEADLADPNACAATFERAEQQFGPVEILVNNAAFSSPDSILPETVTDRAQSAGGIPIAMFNIADHDRHFHVNVRAPMLMMRELARRHIARNGSCGRIINISTDGASGFPTEVSYGASKHALESLTRAAATELGPYGITANVASLGPIQTGYVPPESEQRIADNTPLRRTGQPDDVADVVVFLASHQARWITGQLIYVGGGHAMPL